jgi:hypothetical protein
MGASSSTHPDSAQVVGPRRRSQAGQGEAKERRCTKPATLQAEQRRACNFSNPHGITVIDIM